MSRGRSLPQHEHTRAGAPYPSEQSSSRAVNLPERRVRCWLRSAWRKQTGVDRARYGLRTTARAELIQQLCVIFGGVLADDQRRSNLSVGLAFRHQRQH